MKSFLNKVIRKIFGCRHKSTVVVINDWSMACLDCKRYTYDTGNNWLGPDESFERLVLHIRILEKRCIEALENESASK